MIRVNETNYFFYYVAVSQGKIHLVRTQNLSKNKRFLPLDTHTYVCLSGSKKYQFFGRFCVRANSMIPRGALITLP